jgi:hypothetical protein
MNVEAILERLAAVERRLEALERQALPYKPFGPLDNIGPLSGCPVCGIGKDGQPYGYVCNNPNCPSAIRFTA